MSLGLFSIAVPVAAPAQSGRAAKVSRTGPSATITPEASSTMSRSTRSIHGPSTCSTTTSVKPCSRTAAFEYHATDRVAFDLYGVKRSVDHRQR